MGEYTNKVRVFTSDGGYLDYQCYAWQTTRHGTLVIRADKDKKGAYVEFANGAWHSVEAFDE